MRMQVTKDNFKQTLPVVEEAIQNASFLAIDAEFSGLNIGHSIHAFDTLQERYSKQRKAAKAFIIVQFGLSAFKYNHELDCYGVQSFNFYICPRPYARNAPEVHFQCQSSSMDFLSSQHLDFNNVFREGISYMLPSEVKRLLETLQQRHADHNKSQSLSTSVGDATAESPSNASSQIHSSVSNNVQQQRNHQIEIPEQYQTFVNAVLLQVEQFLVQDEKTSLDLEPCNGYQRKLVYQSVQQKYGRQLLMESVTTASQPHIRLTIAKSATEFEQLEKDKRDAECQTVQDAVGFSEVIRLVSQSGKLVVGHNMMLDMLHIIEHFVAPLPEDYLEFKDMFRCVFPRILDTKVLATSETLKDLLPNTTLADLQRDLEKSPFSRPKVVPANKSGPSYSNLKEQLHEAGYDSYITGLCFISMADYLGEQCKPPVTHVEPHAEIIRKFWNKVHLMRMCDMSYMNLDGPDQKISRHHVFHLSFPSTWKSGDITRLFSPFGNVQIVWLDSSSAFVGLHRRDLADLALRSLHSAADRSYQLCTYSQYSLTSSNATSTSGSSNTPSNVSTTPRLAQSGKRKLRASDTGNTSPPVGVGRRSTTRISLGSTDIPTIPEEDPAEIEESAMISVTSPTSENESTPTHTLAEPMSKVCRVDSTSSNVSSDKMFEEPVDW